MKKFINCIKRLTPLLLFFSLVFFLWRGLSIDPHKVPSVLLGRPVPNFNLPELTQPNLMLTSKLFKGHVSLLNVWATWCFVCSEEHPILMAIANTHRVKIYGLDYKDLREKALNYLDEYGNPYQKIGFDEMGKIAINWGVYGTPETFIIDQQGIIRYKQIGPITQQLWKNKLLPIITRLQSKYQS